MPLTYFSCLGEPLPYFLLQVRWLHGGAASVNKGFPGQKTEPVVFRDAAEPVIVIYYRTSGIESGST